MFSALQVWNMRVGFVTIGDRDYQGRPSESFGNHMSYSLNSLTGLCRGLFT